MNTISEALQFLAENERSYEGQARFNSEHLYQLSDECQIIIDLVVKFMEESSNEQMKQDANFWLAQIDIDRNNMYHD